ncbi:glycine betaine ABC transporter substrate-binding protein [Streptomyces sp. GD-15H]|uniref:glycine betaine ABC transporter substrate-binding protein n=1 Tax=Streptomyces sp. GD-15H TaxID=3129112 RepID=UPI00324851F7
MRRRRCLLLAGVLPAVVSSCGLSSDSPMLDDVEPGSIGQGGPLEGAELTVTSKEFTEQLILGAITGIAFQAAGAYVIDRTGIQGSVGSRAAVVNGDADAAYEYTGPVWITYQGQQQAPPRPARAGGGGARGRRGERGERLEPSSLNSTYALAMNQVNFEKYGTKSLSDVAALVKSDSAAVALCVEGEFANRADGLPGMEKAYGMNVGAGDITQMDTGIIYAQTAEGACAYGEVFATDGRIKSMNLVVREDDQKFFPHYHAAPMADTATLQEWPAIAEVLDPVTAKLDNEVARTLNAKVDVDGEDPHQVAPDWMVDEGFVEKK